MSNRLPNRYFRKIDVGCPWNLRFCSKTRWQMLLLVSVRHVGARANGHQHGVSIRNIQISIILGKSFQLGYLVYELFLRPKSWRGSLYIYLLSFPRFWTLSIERFWFLFWSILNGVTLKTSNMWTAEWMIKWRMIIAVIYATFAVAKYY